MAEIWERLYDIINPAIVKVYEPAMQRYFAPRLERAYGPDWFDLAFREAAKQAKKAHRETFSRKGNAERIREKEIRPQDALEATDFPDLVHLKAAGESIFPRKLRDLLGAMIQLQGLRNTLSHPGGRHKLQPQQANLVLTNCKSVLDAIEDQVAVNEIEELQNQLNDLDSEGGADLAEQDGGSHSAQSDEAPNAAPRVEGEGPPDAPSEDGASLAEQDGEPRDAQPEDGASLAEQDGEPPARRTEGGGLSREWLYVFGIGVLIIAVIAAALGSRSGNGSPNGQPVCSDIGDVELAWPRVSDGTVALGRYCTDEDDDELTFSAASSDNDIVSAVVAGDLLTLIAGDGDGGTATITVTATDPDERSATASFDVTVNPSPQPEKENQPPDCVDAADITIVEGGEREVSISCSDPDGDVIMLRVSGDSQTDHHSISPDAARIDGSGARPFTITGLSSSVGTNYVEIEADDGKGGTDRVRFGVVVEDDEGETEDEPSLGVPPKIEGGISCTPSPVAVNASVECRANVSGTTPLTYEWHGGSSSDATSASYNASFSSEGSQSVSLTVSNAAGSDDGSTTVQVMAPPTISSLGCPSSATVNQAVTCSPTVSGTGPFTYRWSSGDWSGSSSSYSSSWSTTGTQAVSLTVTNAVGDASDSTSVDVGLGITAPTINSISCTPSPATTNASVNCTASLSDGAPDSYDWSGGASRGRISSYSPSWSSAGTKTVTLTVRNSAGSDSESTTVSVMTPPTIGSLGCPSSATVNQAVTCSPTVSGTEPLAYMWSGSDSSGSTSSSIHSPRWSTPGRKTVSLTVRNSVGSDSRSTTVEVPEPPPPPIRCTPFRPKVNETVTCTPESPLSGWWAWSWSGGDSSGSSATYSTSFSTSGTKTVTLTVRNSSGRERSSRAIVEVTESPPRIDSINCSPSSPTVNQQVTCTASLGGGDPDTYSWSGGDSSGSGATYRTSFSSSGDQMVWLTVRNSAGRDSKPITVTVPPPGPVINSISCTPSPVAVSASVSCRASLSGGAPTSYSWSGGSSWDTTSNTYSASFSSEGTQVVSLLVSNGGGRDDGSTTVQVMTPPTISSLDCPSPAKVNQAVTCLLGVTGSAPFRYSWSGGGFHGSSSSYSPSWSTAGSKTVSLTVSNGVGEDSRSTTVIIGEGPKIRRIDCTPSSPTVNQQVTCTASLDGGDPDTYSWSGGDSSGSSATYYTSFSSSGDQMVWLTVRNNMGDDDDRTTVSVIGPPVIHSISCDRLKVLQGSGVSCSASVTGSAPLTYSWSGGNRPSGSSSYTPALSAFGRATVFLTVSNQAGSASASIKVDVISSPPSTGYARCGSDLEKVYYFDAASYTKHHLKMAWGEAAARVHDWGDHMIDHLSQEACDSWQTGNAFTPSNW